MLRAGEVDVSLVFSDGKEIENDLVGLASTELLDEPLLLALPRRRRLADESDIVLETVRDEPWIRGTQPGVGAIEAACRAAGFSP